MLPIDKRIRDTARRIDRLGRYVGANLNGPHVVKSKGLLSMVSGQTSHTIYDLRQHRVWVRHSLVGDLNLPQEEALQRLIEFEAQIRTVAEAKAREEVIHELVQRKMRRITRTKSREFKAKKK